AGCASPQVVTLVFGDDVVVRCEVVQCLEFRRVHFRSGGTVASVADGITYDIDAGIVTSTPTPGLSRIEIRFGLPPNRPPIAHARSEERRVGKECRCRWWRED